MSKFLKEVGVGAYEFFISTNFYWFLISMWIVFLLIERCYLAALINTLLVIHFYLRDAQEEENE